MAQFEYNFNTCWNCGGLTALSNGKRNRCYAGNRRGEYGKTKNTTNKKLGIDHSKRKINLRPRMAVCDSFEHLLCGINL